MSAVDNDKEYIDNRCAEIPDDISRVSAANECEISSTREINPVATELVDFMNE